MRGVIHGIYKGAAEYVLPVRSVSAFKEKGVLTPEEFVEAGDTLVATCPTWSWQAGEIAKQRPFLPPDKQYLITRNVPCLKRASAVEDYGGAVEKILSGEGDGAEDEWLATENVADESGETSRTEGADDIPSMDAPAEKAAPDNDDDIPDMDEFETDDNVMEVDEASLSTPYLVATEPEENIIRTRTYDISITYDKFYQTPRMWLCGYDEMRQPLAPEQALEDVSHDHARKTVTVETHPHSSHTAASIHPCQHASVMMKLSEMLTSGGNEPRVDQYLFLFLKFIAVIIPTIEYDYTFAVGR